MGLLPENDLTNTPWYKFTIDLIGPWSAKTEHFNGEFYTLTCIDTITNLVDLVHIDIKSRFTVTIFTYCKNGCVLPVTKGKPGNYHLPIGKNSVY